MAEGQSVASTPQERLDAGVELLNDLMRSHGFAWTLTTAGVGSGGGFASGEFRRGTRRLELHYRHSLGLVTYHVGGVSLSHEDYMWSVLGRRWQSRYPGFSNEPDDDFRQLLDDVDRYCTDFLSGSDSDFLVHVQRAKNLKERTSRLP